MRRGKGLPMNYHGRDVARHRAAAVQACAPSSHATTASLHSILDSAKGYASYTLSPLYEVSALV